MSGPRACLPALLSLFSGCASAPAADRPRAVEAEGWAPELAGDPIGSSRRALEKAKARAVEQAVGARVSGLTRVDAAVVVRQRLWSELRGRLESYEILDERVEQGFRKTRIKALVRPVATTEPETPPPPPAGTSVAVEGPAALAPSFSRGGFALAAPGAASFRVQAEARARALDDRRLAPLSSCVARVRVKVVENSTGAVVWERAVESAALGADADSASSLALERAAERAGTAAVRGLSEYLWNR